MQHRALATTGGRGAVGAGGGAGQQSRSSDPEEPLVDMAAPDMVAFVKSLDLPPHSLSVPLSPQS